jgi:hypothetical protein
MGTSITFSIDLTTRQRSWMRQWAAICRPTWPAVTCPKALMAGGSFWPLLDDKASTGSKVGTA